MPYKATYDFFLNLQDIMDKKLQFPAWNANGPKWRSDSVKVYIEYCDSNGVISSPIELQDQDEINTALQCNEYNKLPLYRLVITLKVPANTDPSLKLEYSKKFGINANEVLLLGLNTQKSGDFTNDKNLMTLFKSYCTYKPAKVLYSQPNWKIENWESKITNNVAWISRGNDEYHNFNTKEWIFAEYLDWMLDSIKGNCPRFYPDDVANWMLYQLSIIA